MRALLPRAVLRPAPLFQRPRIRNHATAPPSPAPELTQTEVKVPEPTRKKRSRRLAPPPLSAIILNERKDAFDEPNKLKRGAKRGFKKISEDGRVDSRADRINFRPRGPSILKSSEKCIVPKGARN
jgi:hypothetical protein